MPNWEPAFQYEHRQPAGTVKGKWCAYCITLYGSGVQYRTKNGVKGVSAVYVNPDTLEVWHDFSLADKYGGEARLPSEPILGPWTEEVIETAAVVEARVKRAFIDKSLSARATLAVKIERNGADFIDHYASNYFWRKFSKDVTDIISKVRSIKTRKTKWNIVVEYNGGVSRLVSGDGLNKTELDSVKEALDSKLVEATGGVRKRGKPRTRARDENDKPIRKPQPKRPKAPKKPAAPKKPPVPKSVVVNKPATPVKVKPLPKPPKLSTDPDEDDAHVDLIDGPRLLAPQPQPEILSLLELERIIRQQFERSAEQLPPPAWEIIKRNYGQRMSQAFKDKYEKQLAPATVVSAAFKAITRALRRESR
jgi:hypothetical protein